MSKQSPLDTLIELAQGRVDEATRKLGELLAGERSADEKLALLNQYRSEYRNRYLQAARDGIGPDGLRNYTLFIGKLDDAIAQQQQILAQKRNQKEAGQQEWVAERNRLKAFDTLSQRQQQKLAKRESRQEQKLADEHSAKKFQTPRADGDDGDSGGGSRES